MATNFVVGDGIWPKFELIQAFMIVLVTCKNEVYWTKVLPEQWELIQIFRKHEIFRKKIKYAF